MKKVISAFVLAAFVVAGVPAISKPVAAQEYVGQFLATFKEFPPSQKPGSMSLDTVLDSLSKGAGDK